MKFRYAGLFHRHFQNVNQNWKMAACRNKEIGIFFIPGDGFAWAEFLQSSLNTYDVKSMLLDLTSSSQTKIATNVILVSPEFFRLSSLSPLRLIDPHRTIFVLLGTNADEVKNFIIGNKMSSILKDITLFETQSTENCVKALIIGIIKLYEHDNDEEQEIAILPEHDDNDEPYDTLPPLRPSSDHEGKNDINQVAISQTNNEREVILLCNRKGADEINIELSDVNGQFRAKVKATHENKAIYKFSLDKNTQDNNLSFVAKDGAVTIGTGTITLPTSQSPIAESNKLSKLETLQRILGKEDDPVCLMCQALNIQEKTKQALDQNLANKCKSLEPLRRFEGAFFENINAKSSGHSSELWPTLLHFAAEYDLPLFCKELLNFPWSTDACLKLNKESESPIDIATKKNHTEVASILENFVSNDTRDSRSGNVPGNKDSGVDVDGPGTDPGPGPGLRRESTYADMSVPLGRDSSMSFDEPLDDPPPPTPHSSKTYMNFNEVSPPPCTRAPPPPSSRMSHANSDSVYMDMAGKCEDFTGDFEVEPMHRSQSDSQADEGHCGEPDRDDDYEYPADLDDDDISFQEIEVHHSTSEPIITTTPIIHDIQLPTHCDRHSGFFKKFKFFGKHKKDKDKDKDKHSKHKTRDRKMSLPNELSLTAFQQQHQQQGPRPMLGRRATLIPHHTVNRDSSSSTSSTESKDVKALAIDTLEQSKPRDKKKHFLLKDHRKSMRITKAMTDKNNPTPPTLPSRKTTHLDVSSLHH